MSLGNGHLKGLSQANQRLASVSGMLLWCLMLLAYRSHLSVHSYGENGEKSTRGMVWNLFLAIIPLLWSTAFQAANARKRPLFAGIFFFLWLLFLPNAPYLLTDLLHLKPGADVPLWYLLAVLLSCAGTGTMLGYFSLLPVHAVIEQDYGKSVGWVVAACSLLLCGFGIYLGRFLRENSWDVFVHPFRLARVIAEQFINSGSQPHPLVVTLVFGGGLVVGYLVLRVFSPVVPLTIIPTARKG
ncbi:MAG: DUF1361 domain-containing protein [Janthinobacterium lividum]